MPNSVVSALLRLICGSNTAQKKVLARAGWERLASFVSSKTEEVVELWGWHVKKKEGLNLGFLNATNARRMMPDESQKAAK